MPYKDHEKKKQYDREYRSQWRMSHREKYLAAKKRHRQRHKDQISAYRRAYSLKTIYNLTEQDYQLLLKKQGGCCAICGTTEPGGNRHSKHFHVDHNHATGGVRGLLCNTCNRGLGVLGDNIEIIERALIYLKEGETSHAN